MNELLLQDKYLIHFLTERVDGLGYQEVKANTVSPNTLLIEEDLKTFISQTELNKKAWKKLLPQFAHDEDKLMAAFIEFLLDKMKNSTNMAIFINRNRSVNFKGIQVHLFYPSESEIYGDRLFEQNIFSVVQEMPYNFKWENKKYYGFRPDITFFLNGIYIGYTELKSNYTNQSAWKNGRRKVMTNYQMAVERYLDIADTNDKDKSIQKAFLKIFHKAIHITTTDLEDTFVIRTIDRSFDAIRNPSEKLGERYEDVILKDFKAYPLLKPESEYSGKTEQFEEVFRALYAKKMIEKEILYYNFIERELVKDSKGKKTYKHTRGKLIAPRPKQKFGADKILSRIDELLEHENDDDYFINKLRRQLREKGIGTVQANELIDQRLKYKNNKNVYSLLLQYAAGFGKSNIIGWTALQLKDLKYKGEYVYDKIMLIVDRLQLRDQLDSKMFNMNISNSMYIEARNKKDFQKALETDRRIVVVNLQKFNSIRTVLDEDILAQLADIRVAFLIDEIHRSHSNVQHQEMTGLFDELQHTFDKSKDYNQQRKKKNLIIGFTATPSEYVLNRFGEFDIYAESQQIMVPFDSYTMAEAIRDGYILNPVDGLVPVAAKMYYELPRDPAAGLHDDKIEYSIKKKRYYENVERIEAVAKFIVKRLVSAVYPNIGKKAKAMLAVYSIDTAILYHKFITHEYAKILKEKKKYMDFKDAPIFIVYSDSQEHKKAGKLNDNKSEAKVLQEFALAKNGLIIVVDKLQTGFDEPKLHTLFLDKEIKHINAIQTISRVNRTTKNKNDCKIVDFSQKNVNINNIKNAFEKFSNVVVSDFDPLEQEKVLTKLYDELQEHHLFKDNFHSFGRAITEPKDLPTLLQIESNFTAHIRQQEEAATELKKKVNAYFHSLHLIEFLIELDNQYNEDAFLSFWKLYNKEFNTLRPKGHTKDDVSIYYDYKIGIVAPPEFRETRKKSNKAEEPSGRYGRSGQLSILEFIEQRNQEEEAIEELIDEFRDKIEGFYAYLREPKVGSRLMAKMRNESGAFDEEEIFEDFTKLYRRYVRRNRKELSDFFKRESGDILRQLMDDFERSVRPSSKIVDDEVETAAYVTFTLAGNYEDYSNEQLAQLLEDMRSGYNLKGYLKLLLKEAGSLLITVEVQYAEDVALLGTLFKANVLKNIRITDMLTEDKKTLKARIGIGVSTAKKKEYKLMLADGKPEQVLEQLVAADGLAMDVVDKAVLLMGRWKRLVAQDKAGLVKFEDRWLEENRICGGVLDLVNGME